MKKVIGFLVISCFCLSIVVFAESDLSSIGKKLKSFGKDAADGGLGELSKEELKALVDEVIEISLEEYEREFGDKPDYVAVPEEEVETGKKEVMNLLKANPDLLEQARDENGKISAKELVKILKKQSQEETNIIIAETKIVILDTAISLYELDNGFYPSTSQGLSALIEKPNSNPKPTGWNGSYIKEIPLDPWENSYHYVHPGIHNKDRFDLSSYGPDEVESDDDITNWD